MNHICYIALHMGMSPDEAAIPHVAPPLTRSLSVMARISLLNCMCLGKQELPKGRLLPWSDCNKAIVFLSVWAPSSESSCF